MIENKIENTLNKYKKNTLVEFLSVYGHELTIQARIAYSTEQGNNAGADSQRGINEILHRLFLAIQKASTNADINLSSIAYWISAKDQNKQIQSASALAFERTLARLNT